MTADVVVLGVRHHGPGSARSVLRALNQIRPPHIAIEGPPELGEITALAAAETMRPPVAGLVYDRDTPRRASFYPLATFSPEWVALRWALTNGASVDWIDLPAAHTLALLGEAEIAESVSEPGGDEAGGEPVASPAEEDDQGGVDFVLDPIGALAAAAGYDDAERWWEDAIEQRPFDAPADGGTTEPIDLKRFAAVSEAIASFRASVDLELHPEHERTMLREAAMRRALRARHKTAAGAIVVVCGAFHAPVLERDAWPSIKHDTALLKGLPKVKVAATWAPWTSQRLAFASGYGAGVEAPEWYRHLFESSENVVARWMVRTARLLRSEGYDASAAAAVEATRLAETLAAVRGRPIAGLAEVGDAAVSVLCHGSPLPIHAISRALWVGHEMGSVPPDAPMVPLAQDLAKQQKTLRLKRSAEERIVTLDLRQPAHLARSVLFNRLQLLGLPWATRAAAGRTYGTFKEVWKLEWQPEFAITVIEAGLHGTTVESAASAKALAVAEEAQDLASIANLVEACLEAELPQGLHAVLQILSRRSAVAPDQVALMGSVEPLARTRRYGNVRRADVTQVAVVLETIVRRAAVGLPSACGSLDDAAANAMREAIESVHRGVSLTDDGDLRRVWSEALLGIPPDTVHGLVAGRVTRLLLDDGDLDHDEAARRLARALSTTLDPRASADWLDGFLAGDFVLLVHDAQVFGLIDTWLAELDPELFDDLLPLLRRTFSRFQRAERRQIGEVASAGVVDDTDAVQEIDPERGFAAAQAVAAIIGVDLGSALEVAP